MESRALDIYFHVAQLSPLSILRALAAPRAQVRSGHSLSTSALNQHGYRTPAPSDAGSRLHVTPAALRSHFPTSATQGARRCTEAEPSRRLASPHRCLGPMRLAWPLPRRPLRGTSGDLKSPKLFTPDPPSPRLERRLPRAGAASASRAAHKGPPTNIAGQSLGGPAQRPA